MTLKRGARVRSLRDARVEGIVIGYGALQWHHRRDTIGDDDFVPVYLVEILPASSSLGAACAVLRADQVVEVV